MDLDKLNLIKLGYSCLVLGSSQFLIMPQLPQKMMLATKVVKINSKNNHLASLSKSVTHSVVVCLTLQNTNGVKGIGKLILINGSTNVTKTMKI